MTFELADATAEVKLAEAHESMIGNEERLREAITRSSGAATRITGKRPAASCDYQDHNHIENYLTEALWALIMSDCPMHQKLASMAEFVVDKLGLHYAGEQTFASIVGVVLAAHAKPVSHQRAHDYLNEFNVYAKGQVKKRLSCPGTRRYPAAVADFMEAEPDRYSPSEPPVECQLSAAVIVSGRHLAGARCKNKTLMVGSPCAPSVRNADGAGSIAGLQPVCNRKKYVHRLKAYVQRRKKKLPVSQRFEHCYSDQARNDQRQFLLSTRKQ